MLSTNELKQLTTYQVEVFKDVFATKTDIKGLETKINNVQNSLDAVLKEKTTNDQERLVSGRRIKDLENWVDKAAPKVGVSFEH